MTISTCVTCVVTLIDMLSADAHFVPICLRGLSIFQKLEWQKTCLSCYQASSTHAGVGHRYNKYLTRATAIFNVSYVYTTRVKSRQDTPDSHVRIRTCGIMYYMYMHLMPCVQLHNSLTYIYIMHHQVHVHNSNIYAAMSKSILT